MQKVRVLPIFWLLLLSGSVLLAVAPSWWSEAGTQILEEEGSEENYAPANLGQLKHVAKMAKAHLDESVAGGAGSTITSMVNGFEPRPGMGYTQPQIDAFLAENYAPINLGQLKAVAKPFYDRLREAGYDTKAHLIARGYPSGWEFDYPWDPETPVEENYAPANLGQLKMVFSFDLASYDTDLDGLPDEWELNYFSDLESDESGDIDGDGYTNLEEYQQGTDPTDYFSQGGREVTPVISIIGGNNQSGSAGQYLPDALEVAVWASDTGETLANAPVVFNTLRGGAGLSETKGLVSTTSILEVYTGSDGTAKVHARPANTGVSVVQASAAGEPVEFSINNQDVPTEGLKVWLKADAGVQVQGRQVVSWQDQSGDSRTASQSTDASQPVLINEGINGKPSVRFDGVDDSLGGALGYNGGSADLTIITVHRRTGSTTWGAPVSLSSSQYGTPILTWKNATWELGANRVGVNDTGVYVNSGSTSRGRYLLSSVSRAGGTNGNGGTLSVRSFDGQTALAASGTQSWSSDSTSGYYLGRHWSTNPSTALKGEVAEVLIYNRALTTDELEQIEWYLRDKYALDDSDEDGMQDGWETQYGLDPYFADDADEDTDGDGLTNLEEFQQGSDPTDRYDGVSYTLEINDGNNQSGTGYLGDPLEVVVSGSGSVGIEGAPVTFRVTSGPGQIATENPGDLEDELEVPTDENGLARVHLNVTGTAVVTVRAEAGAQSVEFVANAPTSGMKMWLRADTGITSATGRVSQWTDQSGNAMPAGNGTTSQQPTLVENVLHGKPAVRFDGVDDVLTGTTTYNPSGGDFTILAVHRRATVTEWNSPLSFSTSLTSLGAPLLTHKQSGTDFGISNVGQSADGVYVSAGTMGLNRFSVASLTRGGGTSGNGGALNLRMSNGPVTLTSSGTQTWTSGTATGFYIGKQYISAPVVMKGDVAELIVYNRVLTSGELAQMEDYLQTKYALRDSDSDGMADWWEEQNGLAVGTNDATLDADGDGISNLQEFLQNGDPQDYYNRGSAGAAVTPTLAIDSGNNQTGLIDQFLQKPLVVKVTGTGTTPLVNAPVTFKVTNGGGAVAANPGPTTATTLTVQTGSTGLAQIFYRQGTEKSVGNTIVATTGTSSVTFQTYTSADDKGLVGQWRFDEGSGLSVADESAFVNSGTLGSNGPTFGPAINSGSSLEFDGTGNDNVYVPDGPNTGVLNFGKGSFSLSFWFKSNHTGHGRLLGNGSWYDVKGYSIKLTRNASNQYGKLGFYLSSSGTNVVSPADMGVTTLNTFNDNVWHHVAAVVDREQARVHIYVDGVSQQFDPGMSFGTGLGLVTGVPGADISAMNTLQADSGERMRFGQFQAVGDPYKGLLDEVHVYGKALTADAVQELFERDGPLQAIEQEVTVPEDTLGTIVLRHRGGGDQGTATYTIVEEPENGAVELEGDTVKYYPNGHFSGSDAFRFQVTKNGDTSEADVNLTVSAVNDPPLVSVGGGKSIVLPDTVTLTGTITDIDSDPEGIRLNWVKISGPGTVIFSDGNASTTTASFSQSGEYILRLIASDGWSIRSDSLVVVANATNVENLPDVTLVAPLEESNYQLNEQVLLKASAVAATGRTIAKVEFFEGSRKIGEVTTSDGTSGLYEFNWQPSHLGVYAVSALTIDSTGVKTFSDPVTVIVANEGWFSSPGSGAGNEGLSGSGGAGGMPVGSLTGTGASHGPASWGLGTPKSPPEDDPEKDTDGDGVPDFDDAVPQNPNMTVLAAKEVFYAIVDLGTGYLDGVNGSRGINDRGEVLLTKVSGTIQQGFLWSKGQTISIGTGHSFVGPLQNGSVFKWGETVDEIIPDGVDNDEGNKYKNNLTRISRSGDTYDLGYGENGGSVEGRPLLFYDAPNLLLTGTAFSEFVDKRESAIAQIATEDIPSENLWCSCGTHSRLEILNDNGDFTFRVSSSFTDLGTGDHGTATVSGLKSASGVWQVLASGYAGEKEEVAFNDGKFLSSLLVNNAGVMVASIGDYGSEDGPMPSINLGAWTPIPGCQRILDINEALSDEGPYILGILQDDSVALWTSFGLNMQPLGALSSAFPGGTVNRLLSNNLVVPLGDKIWRNGRLISLRELCGQSDGVENITSASISPNREYILAEADISESKHKVILIPIEVVSRDKFLAGSFEIPEGWDEFEMEFLGPKGEKLGRYGRLLGGGSTKVYDSVTDILSEKDINSGGQPAAQKVWFVKDPENDRKVDFYTCFNSVGEAQIKFYLNGTLVGRFEKELTVAKDFADTIDYVDSWVKGESFYFPNPTPPSGLMRGVPMLMVQAQVAPEGSGISNLTRACLIPFFNVINTVEGLSSVSIGLFDGVRNGIQDDWQFIQLIRQTGVVTADYAYQQASTELHKWKNDPRKRASELKKLADKFCEGVVFEQLGELREDLSTWEGFKEQAWMAWGRARNGAEKAWAVGKSSWSYIVDGMIEWADDFCVRAMTSTEQVHWNSVPWAKDDLLAEINEQTRLRCYIFGYTFGYISEQIAVGAMSVGTVKVAQIATKGGASLAANLAKRTAANLAARSHLLKAQLAELTEELSVDLAAAYQRGLSLASTGPTGDGIDRCAMEIMQEGANAGKLVWRDYAEALVGKINLRKFAKQGGENVIERQLARLMHILGEDFSFEIGRNFMKVADEVILVPKADGTVDEFFEAFFKAFEGNSSLMKHADDIDIRVGGTSEAMSVKAKATLKKFLSDPNAGKLWEIDVPAILDNEPAIPHNYWVRGILGELAIYKRTYKNLGYSHAPTAAGYDFTGPAWVQIKTLGNPDGAIGAMREAVDNLIEHSPANKPLKLHILKKPGSASDQLQTQLIDYIGGSSAAGRMQLIIQEFELVQ